MDYDVKIATWIRWIILIPVGPIAFCLTGLGWIGTGFAPFWSVIGFLCAFPVFLLNFWSAKIAAIGMWLVLLATYLPEAIQNWPRINPFALLFSSGADELLMLVVGLTQLASLAPILNRFSARKSEATL